MTTSWSAEEIRRIASAEEIEIAPAAPDRGFTPVWVVRVGDEMFVRSYRGEAGQWYQAARADGRARVRVSEVERAVTVEHPADLDQEAIAEAYATSTDATPGHTSTP